MRCSRLCFSAETGYIILVLLSIPQETTSWLTTSTTTTATGTTPSTPQAYATIRNVERRQRHSRACNLPDRIALCGSTRQFDGDQELNMEALTLEQFKRRRDAVQSNRYWNRPPSPLLTPRELITALLEEMRGENTNTRQDGVRILLEASTDSWRQTLLRSVGAPPSTTFLEDEDSVKMVVPTLEAAMSRPKNQFAILVGGDDQYPNYRVDFPTDPVEYPDEGTCWVECRLRDDKNDELLVVMGWSLEKRATDSAWLVAALDWQDFREEYRPGIGREEWERICG